jgi:hypothetical protein
VRHDCGASGNVAAVGAPESGALPRTPNGRPAKNLFANRGGLCEIRRPSAEKRRFNARVAELADAHGSGPCGATRGGSNPLASTISKGRDGRGAKRRSFSSLHLHPHQESGVRSRSRGSQDMGNTCGSGQQRCGCLSTVSKLVKPLRSFLKMLQHILVRSFASQILP